MTIDDSMIEGFDYVRCPICGYPTKILSTRHYKTKHGLDKNDFFKKFPNYSVCCEKRRQEVSEHTKKTWKNSDTREKRSSSVKDALNREEVKKKISENSKAMWGREGFREENSERIRDGLLSSEFPKEQSQRMKEFWEDSENKKVRSGAIRDGINTSGTFKESHAEMMREMWSNKSLKEDRSERIRNALKEPEEKERRSEKSKEYWSKESSRLKQSEASKRNWKNPEYVKSVTDGYKMFYYQTKSGDVIYLRSSYEEKVCKYLEDNDIRFEYQMKGYKYFFEGREHIYWPDFFLIDLDLILEVKPDTLIEKPLIQEKYHAVIDKGDNIIFVSEKDIKDEESFLNLIWTSTTIRKQGSIGK